MGLCPWFRRFGRAEQRGAAPRHGTARHSTVRQGRTGQDMIMLVRVGYIWISKGLVRFKEMWRYVQMPVPETMCGSSPAKRIFHTCDRYERMCHNFDKYECVFHACLHQFCERCIPVKISKLTVRICHTCKNVIYSCEFFIHVWQIRSVKTKVQQSYMPIQLV